MCVGVGVCGCASCVSVFMCTPCRTYMFEPDGQILEFFGEFRDHKGDEVRYPIVVPWFTLNGLLCAWTSLCVISSDAIRSCTGCHYKSNLEEAEGSSQNL